jgi:hypothetical protein
MKGMLAMTNEHSGLRAEFETFENRRKAWLPDHEGQYVVMFRGELAGFFNDYAAGVRAGIAKFGVNSEFLIQRVREEDPLFS